LIRLNPLTIANLNNMKRIAPLFLVALLPFFAFGQKGYQQDLGKIAAITFPDTPRTTVKNDETVYGLNDSGIVYLAIAAPVKKGLKDIFTKNINDSLFQGVIIGSLRSSKGKLFYKKPIELNGLKGLEFGYECEQDSVRSFRYHQTFYVNGTLIFYGYWSKDSLQADDQGMRAFFNSFKLKIKAKDIVQDDGSKLAYTVGKGIGYVIIAMVIVLLALGVVFLIRKFS
jgi:hypothetical protein